MTIPQISEDLLRVSYLQEVGRQLQKNDFTSVDGVVRDDSNIQIKRYKLLEDNKNSKIETQRSSFLIYDSLRDQTASNYTINIPSGNYGLHFRYLAEELFKYTLDIERRKYDEVYEIIRDILLYQNFGYLLGFDGGFSPFYIKYYNNERYRQILIALSLALLGGSTKSNIEAGLRIFSSHDVEVFELYTDPTSEVYQRFMWRINVFIGDTVATINLDDERNNLERFIKIIKPAHTLFDLGFVWMESFKFTAGCSPIVDGNGNPKWDVVRGLFEFDYGADDLYEDLLNDPSSVLGGSDPTYFGDTVPWMLQSANSRLTGCEQYNMKLDTLIDEEIDTNNFTEQFYITNFGVLNLEDYTSSFVEAPTAYTRYPQLHFDNTQWLNNKLNDSLAYLDWGLQIDYTV